MIFLQKINDSTKLYRSHISRKCTRCREYINSNEDFIQIQLSEDEFDVITLHKSCFNELEKINKQKN